MATKQQTNVKAKLRRVLQNAFKGARVELEPVGTGKIGGSLIWKGFLRLDHMDRQRALAELLERSFDNEERSRVGEILAFTPWEVEAMDREARSPL